MRVSITLTDNEATGQVDVKLEFDPPATESTQSGALALAARAVRAISSGDIDEDNDD